MNIRQFLVPAGKPLSGLAVGLSIFLTFLYLINGLLFPINEHLLLKPESLFKLDLNRISLYPLAHLSFLHLFFNVISIFSMIAMFEESHGTLYTGVILNLLAVFTAIPYCLIGSILFPNVEIGGASGWFFSFLGYFAVKESRLRNSLAIAGNFSFPTLYLPVALLFVTALLAPGSSLPGHALGLLVGYFMGFKESWVAKITPPSAVLKKIETWVDPLINLIPFGIKYYREVEVDRAAEYNPIYLRPESSLPLHNDEVPQSQVPFQGNGRVLGS
ncbi:unnamed protein product [Kluyveromyces dobzhanskii CBS 2104]|uniref:Rhomboid-type serine protease 2 n=1 Tax=Kluyveromyces dobzhanskii CBS 2104 TaxID=1427455 RepID=A0A0A8L6U5_9SACH|nr:unnamed protein product [Kluyveromyces dobzhanskii CBS 2104]